jgi:hypothetical protein
LTANIASVTSTAQSAMGTDTASSGSSNPCLGLAAILGMLMKDGKALLNGILTQINRVVARVRQLIQDSIGQTVAFIKNLINDAIAVIQNAIAAAKAAIQAVIDKIKAEIIAFAKAMLSHIRLGLAALLLLMLRDPCLKALLGSIVSGSAASILKV